MSVPNLFTYTVRVDLDKGTDEWQAVAWREGTNSTLGIYSIGTGPDRAPLVGRACDPSKGAAIELAVENFDSAATAAGAFSDAS